MRHLLHPLPRRPPRRRPQVVRGTALALCGVVATATLWAAASPPETSPVAPGAASRPVVP